MTKKTVFLVCFLPVVALSLLLNTACQCIVPPVIMPAAFPADSDCLSDKALIDTQKEIQLIEQKCPIAQVLPYGGPFYNEPFVINSPDPDGTILIEIDDSVDFDLAKGKALDWVQNQGYENNISCKMVFRVSVFPK